MPKSFRSGAAATSESGIQAASYTWPESGTPANPFFSVIRNQLTPGQGDAAPQGACQAATLGRTGRGPSIALTPVLELDVFEPGKILDVGRDQDQVIYECNRGDLTVNVRSRSPQTVEPCTLVTVPVRRGLVIRENWERCEDNVLKVGLDGRAPFPSRQSVTSVRELVPHWSGDRAFVPVGFQVIHDLGVGLLRDRR